MKKVVLSGIRATGKLHLGNYLGAMRDFVRLQEEYNCFFFIADYHTLTTETDPHRLRTHLPEIVMDYLAIGLDPEKCTIFAQSSVPEVTELSLLLSMVLPANDLLICPTFKEKQETQPQNVNAGLLFYPVLMAADILWPKANLVPVGKDQLPHIYLTQDIARRFNERFGDTFPKPEALQKEAIRIPGLDGSEKMGKSEGNTIELVDTPETIRQKIAVAVTDYARKRRHDPGNPFECNLYTIHEYISPNDIVKKIREGCRTAAIGCVECKKILSEGIIKLLSPLQERRAKIAANPDLVREVLHKGGLRAREKAQKTVFEVREKMGLRQF